MAIQAAISSTINRAEHPLTEADRERIEEQIESLIARLDAADAPEGELEPSGDENDFAWGESHGRGGCGHQSYCEDDEPGTDEEPSLGWAIGGGWGNTTEPEADVVAP